MQGLNVTHLLSVLVCLILDWPLKTSGQGQIEKTQDICVINSAALCVIIVGLGLIFNGRIKGHMKTRFVPKIKALCVSSFSNRILDIGYISSVSSLGLVGVKVGTIH